MKRLPSTYRDPKIINNQYIVKQQISSGSFGIVYLAYEKKTREEVAIKLEKEEEEDSGTLEREIQILLKLKGISGVPQLFWFGFEWNCNVIVLQLLGKDLAHFIKLFKKLSLKSGLQILLQLIDIIQQVHGRGVVHRDLKPENILVGYQNESDKIYLVDYGVSKSYIEKGQHIPFKEGKSFIGTTRYASIAAHKGQEIGRKDDIESIIYVVIYAMKTKLPWQNLQNIGDQDRTVAVGEVKISADAAEVCKDLPLEFLDLLRYLQTLKFDSEPDYTYLKSKIQQAADNLHIVLDNVFEWSEKKKDKEITRQTSPRNHSPLSQDLKKQNLKDQPVYSVNEQRHSSFLKPPEQQGQIQNGSGILRTGSQISVSGSNSSMQIKYIPSVLQNPIQEQDLQAQNNEKSLTKKKNIDLFQVVDMEKNSKSKKKFEVVQSELQKIKSSPQIDLKNNLKFNTDSIVGFEESAIEENMHDYPTLDQKYQQLVQIQVIGQFKAQKENQRDQLVSIKNK